MKTSKGRGKVLITGIKKKREIVIMDGAYTEDGKYFIYKTNYYWYLMDVNSGLSMGKYDNYTTKNGLLKNYNKLTSDFESKVKANKDVYLKISRAYKKLCREYDLKKESE